MISIKRKTFAKKVVNSAMVKSVKIELRIKMRLIWVIVAPLMVPQNKNVVKITSEGKKIT